LPSPSPFPSPFPPPAQTVNPPTVSPPPPTPPALTPVEDQECTGAANKALTATLRFSKAVNTTELAKRLQKNFGAFLGLANGLECEVQVTVVDQEDGGIAPSEQHTTYRASADLGSKTPGSAVVRAREGVKAIADKGGEEFKAIFVDRNVDSETEPLTALDGTSVTVEATMPDPTTIEGCSAEPSKVIGATIQLVGPALTDADLAQELDQDPDGLQAKERELEGRLQRVLDSLENVVFDCPPTFEFTVGIVSESRRSMLSGSIQGLTKVKGRTLAGLRRRLLQTDAGKLTIDMGDDASSDEVSAARDAVRGANFMSAITDFQINGKTFYITASVDEGDVSTDDDDDAKVLGPAIAIPVFFFLVAMGILAVFVVRCNRKGRRFTIQAHPEQV